MNIKQQITEEKEKLYLQSLKVANQTLSEAIECEEEVSSGLLSASASLLKLKLDDVISSSKDSLNLAEMISSIVSKDNESNGTR